MSTQPHRVGRRYELTSPISTGGMGQVWQGYDTVLDRQVAIKLIRPDIASTTGDTDELAGRFRREAKVTARIEHPGVPAVFDADIAGGRLYLVMQMVRGVALSDVLAERGALPVETAVAVAAQICAVLSYAHAVPVIHRDIKPGNVMIAEDGSVKVLDFGIAAVLRTDVTRLTATGSKLGTFAYMPPEQILGGGVSPASDLYSLGCVLHEMCAGSRVFAGETDYVVMDRHVKAPPTPLRALRPELPEDLERLVLHLLAKSPEERPADAQEVHARLAPLLPDALPASATETPPPAAGLPDPTRPYRRPLAPRPRPASAEAGTPAPTKPLPGHGATAAPSGVSGTVYDAEKLDEVEAQAQDLLDDERYAQAVGVLDGAVQDAAAQLGDSAEPVVGLRLQRAFAIGLSGDYRRALPEFDRLAAEFTATEGPDGERALTCRQQAALCRAQLGESTAALRELQDVYSRMEPLVGEHHDAALDLRMEIAKLLLFTGRIAEAERHLAPLHAHLHHEYGPDDPMTLETADLLARIRRAGG